MEQQGKGGSGLKGTLIQAFKHAADYTILPFRLARVGRLPIPYVSPKALVGAFLASQIAMPLTGMLLPTGEDYLKQQGFDPAIAAQLSDTQIRVRDRNAVGIIHSAIELPTIFSIASRWSMLDSPYQAYAYKGARIGSLGTYSLLGQCHVTLPGKDITTKGLISAGTGIPAARIKNVPISNEEARTAVILHEFRHCNSENERAAPLAEADADFYALKKMQELYHNSKIIPYWINFRALNLDEGHDTALYLDAKMRGLPLPSEDLIRHANAEVQTYAKLYLLDDGAVPRYADYAFAMRKVLENHGDQMSSLAKRRAGLYLEAMNYFMYPELSKDAKPGPATQTKGGPTLS